MRYDEVRVNLSAPEAGRFMDQVSFAESSLIPNPITPPEGVEAKALYQEWFDSFKTPPSPEKERAWDERCRKTGEALFETLFASAAAPKLLERVRITEERFKTDNGVRPSGLRLRLLLGDAAGNENPAGTILPISHLPFELIIPPRLPQYLARRPFISIVRTIGTEQTVGPISVSGNLRVLVVTSQPKGSVPLGWAEETERIQKALAARSDTTVEVLKNASLEETCQRLRDGEFHILHFIGHGGYDANRGQWYLLFENNGERQPVMARTLGEQLGDMPRLRLAILNACHSGELAKEAGGYPMAGIAAALSVYGVPAVIGMQVAITDSAAIRFSSAFYGGLRQGQAIETALAFGRLAVDISSPEWATPVLYLRGESSELFDFAVPPNGPVLRNEGPPELELGIRTLVESEKLPHLADWAKELNIAAENLLALEEYFAGRFIIDPASWSQLILPRLQDFLAEAVEKDRPLVLTLIAHGSVAFATGYYFHTKAATRLTLVQVTSREPLRWSENEGACPQGPLWQDFEEEMLDPDVMDVAVVVEVTNGISESVKTYLAESGTKVGRLISARIAGEPGKTRIESGAHAYQLAWQLQQWLKDHTGNRARRRLHLFISAPNGFVFFLGQLARILGPLRLYEYDLEATKHGSYEPSLDLPEES